MKDSTINSLKTFNTGTFAVWPFNIDDKDQLHTKVIILGLNPSAGIEFGTNFHGKRFDGWYKEAFSKDPFVGCYMTDLISYAEVDSTIVIKKWNNDDFKKTHINNLKQQFEILKVTPKTPIVCIGKVTKELFAKAFPEYTKLFHINHPNSYRMAGKKKIFLDDVSTIGKTLSIN